MNRREHVYESLARRPWPAEPRSHALHSLIDRLWDGLEDHDVSWVGVYLDQPDMHDDRRLVLGPCRDRPACSPIGMHGVCGRALRSRSIQIVEDVTCLGEAYIACDPADRSEIVVPIVEASGEGWGVLDLDSRRVGAFDEIDARGLVRVLIAAGLLPASAMEMAIGTCPDVQRPDRIDRDAGGR